jgi:phytoene/squalene synthetase
MYARILNKIEKMNYDVFSHRARVSFLEKCMIAAGVILRGEYL